MADIKYNPDKIIKTLKDVENKTNNKLYKKANTPNKLKEQGDPVGNIIKTGVTSFLSKNKNVSVGDFMNKKSRNKTIEKLKNTGKSSLLDTGQNVINHFRNEDVARFDKLVKAIRSSDVTKKQSANLLKIAGKVRGIKESRVMNSSSIEKSGPTIDVKATEVKDKKKEDKKKNGAIVKSKGSSLANRGNKNTEVKKQRDPKPYRDKKGEGRKVPWKKVGNKVASGVKRAGKIAQSAVGQFASAYGDSSFAKEELSRRHKPSAITKKKKLEKALTTLELKKKKPQNEAAALAIPLAKPMVGATIGAIGSLIHMMSSKRRESPGQMRIPGFQGAKSKETSWGHSKTNKVRDELNKKRNTSKTRKVNQAQSDAARARENAARRSRGEGELPQN